MPATPPAEGYSLHRGEDAKFLTTVPDIIAAQEWAAANGYEIDSVERAIIILSPKAPA